MHAQAQACTHALLGTCTAHLGVHFPLKFLDSPLSRLEFLGPFLEHWALVLLPAITRSLRLHATARLRISSLCHTHAPCLK